MLLVGHKVKVSKIHGLGVFTTESIPSGSIVWKFDPMFDVEIPARMLKKMQYDDVQVVLHHAEYIKEKDVYRLGNDGDIFMNHSDTPSLIDCGDYMISAHYLPPGSELTCDYSVVVVAGFIEEINAQRRQAA